MKKLMLLGGSGYILPIIEKAHQLGIQVITCDYLPNNTAHAFADRYCNLSVMDKEAVLKKSKEFEIDGIMSFACDPGVVTAAYVAEKMELPFQCSYKAACILQDKGLFRDFLAKNHFNTPIAKRYMDKKVHLEDVDLFHWPVIVKPLDSAGSKGVNKVDTPDELKEAVKIALSASHCGGYIIEDFLNFKGYHSSADPFTVDGKTEFICYSDQLFDKEADNPYTPAMIIWPSSMEQRHQDYLTCEIQRLFSLLGMKHGIYNIETCVDSKDRPYIMEVSPRGGGCRIAEIQYLAYGVDLIENEIRKAVNMPLLEIRQQKCDGVWCEMVVHAEPGQEGILNSISIDSEIEHKYIKAQNIAVKKGDYIQPFTGANMSLGDIFLRFDTRKELESIMKRTKEWLKIEVV